LEGLCFSFATCTQEKRGSSLELGVALTLACFL